MSMIGNLARIPETTRERLHQNADDITQFLYPAAAAAFAQPKTGLLGRLFGRKQPIPLPAPPASSADHLPEQDGMDLDKAWHVLHFLFTGSDWSGDFPEGFLVACGEPVGTWTSGTARHALLRRLKLKRSPPFWKRRMKLPCADAWIQKGWPNLRFIQASGNTIRT